MVKKYIFSLLIMICIFLSSCNIFKNKHEIIINDIDISNLSYDQAIKQLNSKAEIDLDEKYITINKEQFSYRDIGVRYDFELKLKEIYDTKEYFNNYTGYKDGIFSSGSLEFGLFIDHNLLRNIIEPYENRIEPKNAVMIRNNEEIIILDEINGEHYDISRLEMDIIELVNKGLSGEVDLMKIIDYADVTKDKLNNVCDLIGSYKTYYSTQKERDGNIEVSAKKLDGKLLLPNEILSLNSVLEPYTELNGYRVAKTFSGNKVVDGIGGGACQVSSTLYMSALSAELEIIERNSHSLYVSYIGKSMDATLADDDIDLVIKNNTNNIVYFSVLADKGKLEIKIYGKETRNEDRSIKFVSKKVSNNVFELYKNVYSKGILVDEIKINTSVYKND